MTQNLAKENSAKNDFRIRLLIVDDEQTIRRLCSTVGESLGFSCLEAESGDAALALLDEQPVHMVLTDMVMPRMSGIEFLEQVKSVDYLGLRWQENCQWHKHQEKVVTSATRVRYLISSVISRDHPPLKVVRQLCHALIRTKFCYGMPVWYPNSVRGWAKLDAVITAPMRQCLRLPRNAFQQSVLVETNTLSMRMQYERAITAVAFVARAFGETLDRS